MKWFEKHLNWTWVLANSVIVVGSLWVRGGLVTVGIAIVALLAILLVSGWVIIQKGRSLWWLLLSVLGSPLWLTSKKTESLTG